MKFTVHYVSGDTRVFSSEAALVAYDAYDFAITTCKEFARFSYQNKKYTLYMRNIIDTEIIYEEEL